MVINLKRLNLFKAISHYQFSSLNHRVAKPTEMDLRKTSQFAHDILLKNEGIARSVLLNRPKALNALNLSMIRSMTDALLKWQKEDSCEFVVIDKANRQERAFCAGGDVVKMATDYNSKDKVRQQLTIKFFEEEYRLNHLIGTFSKPIVAVLDGIVMGGGVGITMHAPIRIATENSLFAMPETNIGLIPDVGGSFFLSRMDGYTGIYLGLTGARLKGIELYEAGLATHFIHSSRLETALQQVKQFAHSPSLAELTAHFDTFAADEVTNLDWSKWGLAGQLRRAIDRCFRYNSMTDILEALAKEHECIDWAKRTQQTLLKMSPSSCKAALRQIRFGHKLDFASCFRLEYQIVQRIMERADFFEGVNAALIAKTKSPQWKPNWENVEQELPDKHLHTSFGFNLLNDTSTLETSEAPCGPVSDTVPGSDLCFTNNRTFVDYPARCITGLPFERDVRKFTRTEYGFVRMKDDEQQEYTINWFLRNWGSQRASRLFPDCVPELSTIRFPNSRNGIAPRVAEILDRMLPAFNKALRLRSPNTGSSISSSIIEKGNVSISDNTTKISFDEKDKS